MDDFTVETEDRATPQTRLSQALEGKPWLWQGRFGPAFWTTASLISLVVNVILISALLILGSQLFSLKSLLSEQLIGGLYQNFVRMDEATIRATVKVQDTITVQDEIPVVFDLPLKQDTAVVLTKRTLVQNARIWLNGSPVNLDIVLREGTQLDIRLDMVVPVSQTLPVTLQVPVELEVPVDIPLRETELHAPFKGLQDVLNPYRELLAPLPNSWQETPLCGPEPSWLCAWVTRGEQ